MTDEKKKLSNKDTKNLLKNAETTAITLVDVCMDCKIDKNSLLTIISSEIADESVLMAILENYDFYELFDLEMLTAIASSPFATNAIIMKILKHPMITEKIKKLIAELLIIKLKKKEKELLGDFLKKFIKIKKPPKKKKGTLSEENILEILKTRTLTPDLLLKILKEENATDKVFKTVAGHERADKRVLFAVLNNRYISDDTLSAVAGNKAINEQILLDILSHEKVGKKTLMGIANVKKNVSGKVFAKVAIHSSADIDVINAVIGRQGEVFKKETIIEVRPDIPEEPTKQSDVNRIINSIPKPEDKKIEVKEVVNNVMTSPKIKEESAINSKVEKLILPTPEPVIEKLTSSTPREESVIAKSKLLETLEKTNSNDFTTALKKQRETQEKERRNNRDTSR
ncbi:MAG: hypothetical protein LBT02_02710 [Rickettsiales bacterium]|jgi:hypothetical protein|nr:hypothetical protein [Rickettsiales bacterium]